MSLANMAGNFVPFSKTVRCANKDCSGEWSVIVTKPPPILMCGGDARVCEDCSSQGYSVCNGMGDGLYHLYKHDEEISVYNRDTAYNITRTIRDVHQCIFTELAEGHPPSLDTFPRDLLEEYVQNEKDWGTITRDEESGVWWGEGWCEKINAGIRETTSDAFLVNIDPAKVENVRENTLYFVFCIKDAKYILYFDLLTPDIDFLDCPWDFGTSPTE